MLLGSIALASAAAFAGAAFYVGAVEQPARLTLPDEAALAQWKPSYARATPMQASLAVLSGLCGLAMAWTTRDWRWAAGGIFMLANWPYTFLAIMPTNRRLSSMTPGDPAARELIVAWGQRHAVRTMFGISAVILFLWAAN